MRDAPQGVKVETCSRQCRPCLIQKACSVTKCPHALVHRVLAGRMVWYRGKQRVQQQVCHQVPHLVKYSGTPSSSSWWMASHLEGGGG